MPVKKATFAAGCFWGVEEAFRRVGGVVDVMVGYTGGLTANPTYEDVCTGATGHTESVQIDFESSVVSYPELLRVFWQVHDPTQLNRQGPDVGTQYRSAIFYHDARQKEEAEVSRRELEESGVHRAPIVTEIVQASTFWPAEEWHQGFIAKCGLLRNADDGGEVQ